MSISNEIVIMIDFFPTSPRFKDSRSIPDVIGKLFLISSIKYNIVNLFILKYNYFMKLIMIFFFLNFYRYVINYVS